MSKHKTAEEKLKVGRSVRLGHTPRPKSLSQNQLSPAPPKGTTSNNQYR